MEYLITHGANCDIKDKNGNISLNYTSNEEILRRYFCGDEVPT